MCWNNDVPDVATPAAPAPAPAKEAEVQSGVADKGAKKQAKKGQAVFYRRQPGLTIGGSTGSGINTGGANR